jgi:predicted anti-sigma-YlaC factor YlaD
MNHKPYLDWMQAALEAGEARLAPEHQMQLDAHLTTCAECRLTWDALQEVERLFTEAPAAAPRPGFTSRFKARMARRHSQPRVVWGALVLGLSAVGAAALVLPLGIGFLASVLNMAQQPATATALYTGLTSIATFVASLVDALFIAGRALFEWAVYNPLVWASSLTCLALTGVWLYYVRKLIPEVSFR